MPPRLDPTELVLLVIVVVSALIAIKVLLDLSSRHHRSRYTRAVRFDLIIGVLLGASLPWVEPIGLAAAAMTAILFLGLSILMLLESKMISIWRIRMVRRERIKEWFLHFSVTTGVVGIVTTLLSIVVPPFLQLSLGFLVPLAFDSLSVLSALLEFTLPSTPYSVIFALVFQQMQRKNRESANTEIRIEDIEEIAHQTAHSRFEVLDAIQSLVEQGLAKRNDEGFALCDDGVRLLRLNWEETSARVSIQLHHVESEIKSLEKNLALDPRRYNDMINQFSESISDVRDDCGLLVEPERIARIRQTLGDLRRKAYRPG